MVKVPADVQAAFDGLKLKRKARWIRVNLDKDSNELRLVENQKDKKKALQDLLAVLPEAKCEPVYLPLARLAMVAAPSAP